MSTRHRQPLSGPSGSTLQIAHKNRLARTDREKLWKGLERFVNCSDSLDDFNALAKAFHDFWPVDVRHFPGLGKPVRHLSMLAATRAYSDRGRTEFVGETEMEKLNWHTALHDFFLFYRDTLRSVWGDQAQTKWPTDTKAEFLLGLSDLNERALEWATAGRWLELGRIPLKLGAAWKAIASEFSTVDVKRRTHVAALWKSGELNLEPQNEFQEAFYLLFRQSWRARMCPRCQVFFVALKPKQVFCGTVCSAGSRLASNLKWWRREGKKWRSAQEKSQHKQSNKRKQQ